MRVPVHRIRGKPAADTPEDVFAALLATQYTVARNKSFSYVSEAGEKKTLVVDLTLPKHKLMIEVQGKQDTKSMIAEMFRERIARDLGWGVCRFTEKEFLADGSTVLYKIQREIERRSR